jgi:hypothetical protein
LTEEAYGDLNYLSNLRDHLSIEYYPPTSFLRAQWNNEQRHLSEDLSQSKQEIFPVSVIPKDLFSLNVPNDDMM